MMMRMMKCMMTIGYTIELHNNHNIVTVLWHIRCKQANVINIISD